MRASRIYLSILLAVALTTVFSLNAFAAPNLDKRAPEPAAINLLFLQESGTLTGRATVNGATAESGATIMSGSTIASGDNSVTIDLGPLGRIELRPHTTIALTFSAGSVSISTQCSGDTEVEVTRGSAEVRRGAGDSKTVTAGNDEKFAGSGVITTAGGTDLIIDCESRDGGGGAFVGAGLIGLLALIGVGSAVALGIAIGDEDDDGPRTPASPGSP